MSNVVVALIPVNYIDERDSGLYDTLSNTNVELLGATKMFLDLFESTTKKLASVPVAIDVVDPQNFYFSFDVNASVERECCFSQAFREDEGADLTNFVKLTLFAMN